ncbi:MAG: reductase [Burkholderiaceae bacterium]
MSSPDPPIAYIERIRTYYQALGYGLPYEWPQFADVPFHPVHGALSALRVGLITTAAPYQAGKGEQGPGAPYNAKAKFYTVYSGDAAGEPQLRISHIAIDRAHTTAQDMATYFPLKALREFAAQGRIGSVAPRFHGLPTNRSQRTTLEVDGPEIVARCQADGVDAAVLVANCPVCHQSLALTARLLESSGISTVLLGCARDIVETIGVPRFVFSDFPLGNAAGRPNDRRSQRFTLDLALRLLESAAQARCTVESPLRWSDSPAWKRDYCNVQGLSDEEIRRRREAFDASKAQASRIRERACDEPDRPDEAR